MSITHRSIWQVRLCGVVMLYETLNKGQGVVFNRMTNGENVFITGDAGTGKSYLVRAFDEWCHYKGRRLVKTAPTAVTTSHQIRN